jgi:two-component system, chemotaxis family, CheB/CheR fusion protein
VLPARTGMAFILIQHLDPTHASMMVDLLTGHTPLKVREAADGMPLEREHIYLIPPGAYLSIRGGALRLSEPRERHGARLPFDFFVRSMAEELGERAICLILSGTDGDGSLGLKAVKEKAGSSSRRIPTRPSTSRRAAAIVSWPTWNCRAPFRLPRFPRHISVGE